jgi:integrase
MADISLHPTALVASLHGCLTPAEIGLAAAFLEAEKAPATRRAYAHDWHDFAVWCHARAATPLPALPGIISVYLAGLAQAGRAASTISRRVAAIADRHRAAGYDPPPTSAAGVKATLRGIRRTIGVAPVQKQAATAAIVRQMLDSCGSRLIDHRDRALLVLGFAAALRRSELCTLQVDDIEAVADGFRLHVRRSKTDQTGEGQVIAVPHGAKLRPVELVQTWLAHAEINSGFVFRRVSRGGRLLTDQPLATDSCARIIQKLAGRVGLDPANFAGHSLRSGYVTSAVEANAPLLKIAEQTRHRSLDMLMVYSRRANLFVDHSGAAFL